MKPPWEIRVASWLFQRATKRCSLTRRQTSAYSFRMRERAWEHIAAREQEYFDSLNTDRDSLVEFRPLPPPESIDE